MDKGAFCSVVGMMRDPILPHLIKWLIHIHIYANVFMRAHVKREGRRSGGRTACKQWDENYASNCSG